MLLLLAIAATGCAAGRNSETDKERATPYVAQARAGDVAVGAIRIVVTSTQTSGSPEAYLMATFVNRGATADSLNSATVSGSTVQPVGLTTPALALPAGQVVQLGNPDIGASGIALGVGTLATPLVAGTTEPVTFTFAKAGTVTVSVAVVNSDDIGTTASAYPVTAAG